MKNKIVLAKQNPLAVITPPPTKAEILDAMVKLRVSQRLKERAARDAEVKRLTDEADELLVTYVRKNAFRLPVSISLGSLSQRYDEEIRSYIYSDEPEHVSAELRLKDLPRALKAKITAVHKLSKQRIVTCPDLIKREIRDGFTGTTAERVAALLNTPQSRAALEDALEKLAA